jgi:hypothetical protein
MVAHSTKYLPVDLKKAQEHLRKHTSFLADSQTEYIRNQRKETLVLIQPAWYVKRLKHNKKYPLRKQSGILLFIVLSRFWVLL